MTWFLPLLLTTTALAGKWDDAPSDVEVTRQVAAAPTAVHAAVADLRRFSELLPADCATDWQFTSSTAGRGARAKVRYTFGPLKRNTSAMVVDDQPGLIWRIEHEGDKKGFFTQVTTAQTGNGTLVTLVSFLNAPPWPFAGPFHKKVRPAWTDCYERTLTALAAQVSPGPAPVAPQ